MKTILTATAAALVGLSVLTAGPALAKHKHFKGGISITLGGPSWLTPYPYPYWAEPSCFYQKVWVYSPKHGHKIKQKVLVCP